MATIYNLTNVTNSTNLAQLYGAVNEIGPNPFLNATTMFVFVGYIILLVALKNWPGKQAFAASSFVFAMITFFLWTGGLVIDVVFYLFVILTAGGIFALSLE